MEKNNEKNATVKRDGRNQQRFSFKKLNKKNPTEKFLNWNGQISKATGFQLLGFRMADSIQVNSPYLTISYAKSLNSWMRRLLNLVHFYLEQQTFFLSLTDSLLKIFDFWIGL